MRTERYQRRLSRVNRNATRVDIPPHATGMAFDISYKFMAADEQNFIMEHVARLESEGRVEALRENRNAIHVYTFAGRPAPGGARWWPASSPTWRTRTPARARPAAKPAREARTPARAAARAQRVSVILRALAPATAAIAGILRRR